MLCKCSVEALELIEAALRRIPASADALSNRGIVLKALERYEEALTSCDRALLIKLDHIDALSNRAQVLLRQEHFAEALASADAALALKPNHIAALNNRCYALVKLERVPEAVETFRRVLDNRSDDLDALYDLGNALQLMNNPQAALASYDRVLALKPDRMDAVNNSGVLRMKLECFEEALAGFEKAFLIAPDFAEAHSNRANVLLRLGRPGETLEAYDKALAAQPSFATACNNRAPPSLRLIDTARRLTISTWHWLYIPDVRRCSSTEAWRCSRLGISAKVGALSNRDGSSSTGPEGDAFTQPLWLGEQPIGGKTILLHREQGYGDTIHFARYAPLLAARGARIILEVDPPLKGLMSTIGKASEVVATNEPLPAFDMHCPFMSLPLAFATEIATIPASIPYLSPLPERIAKWKARLPLGGAPKIGIVWVDRAAYVNNHNRSIALAQFVRILDTPDLQFVCLQKDVTKTDIEVLRPWLRCSIR